MKTPFLWTGPSKSLKEKIKIFKYILSKSSGIGPERLLEERSNLSSANNLPTELVIEPPNLFLATLRSCKLKWPPIIAGILIDNWLSEASRVPWSSKLPTLMGKEPFRAFCTNHNSSKLAVIYLYFLAGLAVSV